MDVLVREGEATAKRIWEGLADAPSYSTIRKLLSVLEEKGHVKHRVEGKIYVYKPTQARAEMAASALRRMRDTFFGGSVEQVVSGLLNLKETQLSREEVERLEALITNAKREEEK